MESGTSMFTTQEIRNTGVQLSLLLPMVFRMISHGIMSHGRVQLRYLLLPKVVMVGMVIGLMRHRLLLKVKVIGEMRHRQDQLRILLITKVVMVIMVIGIMRHRLLPKVVVFG